MPKRAPIGVNETGRRVGEGHPRAKLTDHEVELIRVLHEQGWGYRRLAEKFDITRGHAHRICAYASRVQAPVRFK